MITDPEIVAAMLAAWGDSEVGTPDEVSMAEVLDTARNCDGTLRMRAEIAGLRAQLAAAHAAGRLEGLREPAVEAHVSAWRQVRAGGSDGPGIISADIRKLAEGAVKPCMVCLRPQADPLHAIIGWHGHDYVPSPPVPAQQPEPAAPPTMGCAGIVDMSAVRRLGINVDEWAACIRARVTSVVNTHSNQSETPKPEPATQGEVLIDAESFVTVLDGMAPTTPNEAVLLQESARLRADNAKLAALETHRAAPLVGDAAPKLTGDDNAIGIVMDLTSLDYVEADGLLAALDEHLRGGR